LDGFWSEWFGGGHRRLVDGKVVAAGWGGRLRDEVHVDHGQVGRLLAFLHDVADSLAYGTENALFEAVPFMSVD
jgi:hypothetical protein